MLDRVPATRLLDLLVVNQVASFWLLVRLDLEQDDVADDRVEDIGVVECLVGIIDRFAVDSLPQVGVVFDLDGQVAADRLDKQAILNGDMWMQALALQITMRPRPFEFMLRWKLDLVIAAGINVPQVSTIDEPLEGLDVGRGLANLKHHVQVWSAREEFCERCLLVVFVELSEVVQERRVRDQVKRTGVKRLVAKAVDCEDVFQSRLGFQANMDVVAEDQAVADGHNVTWYAVIAGGDSLRGEKFRFNGTEDLPPRFVEVFESTPELIRIRIEAVANNFIRAALELSFASGGGLVRLRFDLRHGRRWQFERFRRCDQYDTKLNGRSALANNE